MSVKDNMRAAEKDNREEMRIESRLEDVLRPSLQ